MKETNLRKLSISYFLLQLTFIFRDEHLQNILALELDPFYGRILSLSIFLITS